MMPRNGYFLLLLFVLCLLVVGQSVSAEETKSAKTYTRIISLYGAHTENLIALGAKDKLAGVSRDEADETGLPAFDARASAETFLAARPDLVLMRPMHAQAYPALVEQLRAAGVDVQALQPRTADEMFDYWRTLGALVEAHDKAEGMIRSFEAERKTIQQRYVPDDPVKRIGVYFESMHGKVKTFSPDSIAMFVLSSAGGVNVASDAVPSGNSNIAAYDKERILLHAETIGAFLAQRGAMNNVTREEIDADYAALPAVQAGRVLIVDESDVSRPTPSLLKGISQIAVFLYGSDDGKGEGK